MGPQPSHQQAVGASTQAERTTAGPHHEAAAQVEQTTAGPNHAAHAAAQPANEEAAPGEHCAASGTSRFGLPARRLAQSVPPQVQVAKESSYHQGHHHLSR